MRNTTDPNLRSFINVPKDHHFPIQNLPYGVFTRKNSDELPRIGVAIGDFVLDLSVLETHKLFEGTPVDGTGVFSSPSLNEFMHLGKATWQATRIRLSELLEDVPGPLRDNPELQAQAFVPKSEVLLLLPVEITDYTDFYASKHHAFNVGTMFRGPENALMDNWVHLPVGYHGRASSVIVSGVDIHRPKGQIKPVDADQPIHAPSRLLDFEFEMGAFVGVGNKIGEPISIEEAKDHIFGLVIINDWSARDIQGWEYRPLGPFNAKNFATSISPWVVPMEALEPFLIEAPDMDPQPLEYLNEKSRKLLDVTLETSLQSSKMETPHKIMRSNMKYLYWTFNQMLAHHSSTGCNMQVGDLLGSGTISGPNKSERACLLELTWRGAEPLELPNGETRKFLEDGDTVIMEAFAQNDEFTIGFGEVRTTIMPAHH